MYLALFMVLLAEEQNRPQRCDTGHVTSVWGASSNRVDKHNVKARRRYDEVVKARLIREREGGNRTLVRQVRGRE